MSDESASASQHVGPVIFGNGIARNQLLDHGKVVTFRTSDRTTGNTWWRESRTGPKRGDCHIERLEAACPHGTGQALDPHVHLSGFESVAQWQAAIRRLHGGQMPAEGWLYLVTEGHDAE